MRKFLLAVCVGGFGVMLLGAIGIFTMLVIVDNTTSPLLDLFFWVGVAGVCVAVPSGLRIRRRQVRSTPSGHF